MRSLQSFPQTSQPTRFATLLLAVLVSIAAPLHTATAGDALTSSTSSSTTTRKGILSSLFGSKSSSSSSTSGTSTTSQLERSILGLPIGILKSATSLVSKAAGKTVASHIKTY